MSDLDPAHVEAVADLVGEWLFRMHGIQSSCDHRIEATELLTSTDPAVRAALLAALVRAGVLEEERESATLRRVDLVAEAICPRIIGSCEFCKSAARRIIAFPEEVLSGLVRVGVATREWRGDEYRYVTPWKETP